MSDLSRYTLEVNGRILSATEEQEAIIDQALAEPTVNLLINALAGAAKTSTLRFLLKYLPIEPTLSIAFNKRIADEMARVLPGHVRAATVNSIGHRVWAAAIGKRLVLETRKNYNIIKTIDDALPKKQRTDAYDIFGDLTKALSKAKLAGYVPPTTIIAKSLITPEDFFGSLDEAPDKWFMALVNEGLEMGIKQAYAGLIDFDDQIYMPTLFGGSFPNYKRVMADEVQDFSPLNQAMLEKLVGPSTWLAAVGDPWQSIYAFRGADTKSMGWLRQRFNMHEMTLSVSFRCPRSVVRNAHSRVPHMRWPDWAEEGRVAELPEWSARDIPDNSAIICRNNAPLMTMALTLLREGRGVHLVGTDLGPQLVKALKKFGDLNMPQREVFAEIDLWEAEKLAKGGNAAVIVDKAECLRVFAGFGKTLGAIIAHCEFIFASKGPIQLLSGHKSKGLEWDTCFHIDPHRIPSTYAKEGEAYEQEMNVKYVIETRPKKNLYFVRTDCFVEGRATKPPQPQESQEEELTPDELQ